MSKRIEWVDVCKGFAMLLVMMGHTWCFEPVKVWLYTFHVPLFFFLSGYVFSVKKYSGFKEFLWAKFKTLMIPALLLELIANIWTNLLIHSEGWTTFIINHIIGMFVEVRGSDFSGGLWFVVCLFVVEIIYWFILKISKDSSIKIGIMLVICAVVGHLYIKIVDLICPWSCDAALIAIGFFGCGYIVKNYYNNIFDMLVNVKYLLLILAINIVCVYLDLRFFVRPDMYANTIGVWYLYYIGAFSGIFMSIIFFRLINTIKVLSYIGKNTLVYFAFHSCLYVTFSKMLSITSKDGSNILGIVYVVLSSVILAGIAWAVNKYTPWMLGRFELKRGKIINEENRNYM